MAKRSVQGSGFLEELGARVRTLRKKRGWSQVMLAETVGIHRSFIADLELGRRNISILNLQALAKGYVAFALALSHVGRRVRYCWYQSECGDQALQDSHCVSVHW